MLSGAVLDLIGQSYHWSLMQVEYSTDLVFRSQAMLAPLYEQLAGQAVLNVKAKHVTTFLGHKITLQLAQEIGSRFATCIRRHLHQAPCQRVGDQDV